MRFSLANNRKLMAKCRGVSCCNRGHSLNLTIIFVDISAIKFSNWRNLRNQLDHWFHAVKSSSKIRMTNNFVKHLFARVKTEEDKDFTENYSWPLICSLSCVLTAPKLRSRIPKKKKILYPSPDVSDAESSSECGSDDERLSSSASTSSASTISRSSDATSRSSNYVQVCA